MYLCRHAHTEGFCRLSPDHWICSLKSIVLQGHQVSLQITVPEHTQYTLVQFNYSGFPVLWGQGKCSLSQLIQINNFNLICSLSLPPQAIVLCLYGLLVHQIQASLCVPYIISLQRTSKYCCRTFRWDFRELWEQRSLWFLLLFNPIWSGFVSLMKS